jgi:hypothetical protein
MELKRPATVSARRGAGTWLGRTFRSGSLGHRMVGYSFTLKSVATAALVILIVISHRVSDLYCNSNNGFVASGWLHRGALQASAILNSGSP